LAAATAAFFLLAALSWLFLILSLILFAVNEQRSVCSFRRVAAASLASCVKTEAKSQKAKQKRLI